MGLYIDKRSPYWQYNFKLPGQKKQQGSTKEKIYMTEVDARRDNKSMANKKEAERIMNDRIGDFKNNKNQKKAKRMTVRELLKWANDNYWKHENFETQFWSLLYYFGEKIASEVRPLDIIDYRNEILDEVRKSSVNRYLNDLKAAYNYAIEDEQLIENPVRKIKPFDCTDLKRNKFLKPEEKKLLLENSHGILRDLILFALKTGMRIGEIRRIKWSEVNLERKFIENIISKKGKKIIVRQVPIFRQTAEVIARQPKRGNYLFSYENGEPIGEWGPTHTPYSRLIKKLNIQDGNFTFHDLRHTFASDYLMMGGRLSVLQDILGHLQADTTRRYAHLSKEHLQNEIERLPYEKFTGILLESITDTDKNCENI